MNRTLNPNDGQRPPTANTAPRSAHRGSTSNGACSYKRKMGRYMTNIAFLSSSTHAARPSVSLQLTSEQRVIVDTYRIEIRDETCRAFSRAATSENPQAQLQATKTVFMKALMRRDGDGRKNLIKCALAELHQEFVEDQVHQQQMQRRDSKVRPAAYAFMICVRLMVALHVHLDRPH